MKTIKTKDLKPGMYVVSYGDGSFSSPTTRVESFVDDRFLSKIIRDNVPEVVTDPDRTRPARDTSHLPDPTQEEKHFAEAIGRMNRLYEKSVVHAKNLMNEARLGRLVSPVESMGLVQDMLGGISQNSSAALFLTQLGDYDEYTYTHCVNVSVLAMAFAKSLGLKEKTLAMLGLSGIYHDLGKFLVPEKILNKPGKLTDEEFKVMKSHSQKGYKLLMDQKDIPEEVKKGALEHHERWNGKGYPDGKSGENIGYFARILSVVDVYDAMTSNRVYHKARPSIEVLRFLFKQKDDFSPGLVEKFIKSMGIYPPGTAVKLTDGTHAVVCEIGTGTSLRPVVSRMVKNGKWTVGTDCLDLETLSGDGHQLEISEVLSIDKSEIDFSALVTQ